MNCARTTVFLLMSAHNFGEFCAFCVEALAAVAFHTSLLHLADARSDECKRYRRPLLVT